MKKKIKEQELPSEEKRMTEKDQDVLIKKIQTIIEKEIGSNFRFKTQGSNKSKMLVISGDKKARITEVANLVAKDLKIKEHDCKKKHGSGMKRTVLILIPTVSEESVSLINKRHKLLLKKYGVKTGRKIEIPPVPTEEVKVEAPVQAEEMAGSPKKRKQFDEKYVVSRYLSSVLRFEGLSFGELKYTDKSRDSFTIHCNEERTAEIIEKALLYYIGDKNSVVTSDSFDVLADLSKRVPAKNSKVFCMAPREGSTDQEIEKRLLRVCPGSKPQITCSKDGCFTTHIIRYARLKTTAEVFSGVKEMGWLVLKNRDDSFWVYTDHRKFSKDRERVLENSVNKKQPEFVQNETIDLKREEEPLEVVKTKAGEEQKSESSNFSLDIPSFLKYSLVTKKEAAVLLDKLHSDSYSLSILSEETQNKVKEALLEEWKKQKPEEYAVFLLSVLKDS